MLKLSDGDNTGERNAPNTCPSTYQGAEKSEQDLYPCCFPDWLPGCTLDSHLVEEYDYFGLVQSNSSAEWRKQKIEFAFLIC